MIPPLPLDAVPLGHAPESRSGDTSSTHPQEQN